MSEMRYAIPISGKDSLATALVQRERAPDLAYEYFFNDTGFELPDTLAWLTRVEAYLGAPIVRVGDDLEDIIAYHGILPSFNTRFCTHEAKINPTEQHFAGTNVVIFYGLRADEPARVGYSRKSKAASIMPVYPLREEGYTLPMVWAKLEEVDLLPPAYFWQTLYDAVIVLLGDNKGLLDALKPWERRMLFAWRSRDNCYSCFFQRQYEWIGLLEAYPDLFWHSVKLEETTGGAEFTLNSKTSLRQLAAKKDKVIAKRARAIVRAVTNPNGTGESATSLLDATSCGLLCGK